MPDLSPWTGEDRAMAARIVRFIDTSLAGSPAEPFETLAVALHAHQAAHCPVIASLSDGSLDPSDPDVLARLPAVPVDLFKRLPVGRVAPDDAVATFQTSGTTGGGRGTVRLRSTALYDHGARAQARRFVDPWPARTANLLLDPAAHPESSLSHMVNTFAPDSSWHLGPQGIDADGFSRTVHAGDGPLFVGATAFALAELLEADPDPLPEGAVLMVTGGFKGRTTHLDQAGLHAAARAQLRPAHLLAEYGMTELSSQLWGLPDTPYTPPPWLRVVAIDPIDERPVPTGTPGQLRFIDLANLDTAVAIETLDRGIVHEDGRLTLLGRLTDAPVRGCSLTVEDVQAARRR